MRAAFAKNGHFLDSNRWLALVIVTCATGLAVCTIAKTTAAVAKRRSLIKIMAMRQRRWRFEWALALINQDAANIQINFAIT
jgi:hypothetical protein